MTDLVGSLADRACLNPVFVIGSPRSGTSIVPWSLAQHPRFWTSTESAFLPALFPPGSLDQAFSAAESTGWAADLKIDQDTFDASLGLGINVLLTGRSDGRRWIDQTPANTTIAPQLARLFPQAHFLHMVRDGRRVVHSMQHFRRRLGANLAADGRLPEWAGDFRNSVRTWRNFVRMALDFTSNHPDRCVVLRLEDVTRDARGEFKRLINALGEEADPRPAEYFTLHRINSSFGDIRGNAAPPAVHPDPDPFLAWSGEEQRIFVEEGAQKLVEALGYPPSSRDLFSA